VVVVVVQGDSKVSVHVYHVTCVTQKSRAPLRAFMCTETFESLLTSNICCSYRCTGTFESHCSSSIFFLEFIKNRFCPQ
jgi:hypothetical protein